MKGRQGTAVVIGMLLAAGLVARPRLACAGSAPAQATSGVTRALGTVTAIQGNTITLKTDAGAEVSVTVQESTRMLRIEPGQKTLEGATPVQLADLQVGDRILAAGKAAEGGGPVLAATVILMKHTDIVERQHQEQADWQKRGVGGLVRAVDAAAGTITLATGAASTAKKVTVRVSKNTVIRRYAPDSVKFSDAKPGKLDQIQPGDQLEARGNRSADGSELTAEEIVSGAFRNIAGTISSTDAAANEITVMDLKTKQPVTVKITAESQVRKLPEMMAQMIAARLKGTPSGPPGASPAGPAQAGSATPAAERPAAQSHGGGAPGTGGWHPGGAGGPPSFQQMLSHLPPATLADLSKGDAVMIVATGGAAPDGVTAITLLSGVEPILTAAPGGAQESILSPWSLSAPSGGDASASQ
jgi:Domain of unknown function (DUF5666)